ncbi:MAG TPA: glycosyltransferase family 1 protein [Terriglobia bacterium]|nr:glycosyltransferase family 1 protein [Terriglobia bacterium]
MAQIIFFDGYVLARRHAGTGIHRYAVNLLRELEKITAGAEGPEFQIGIPSGVQPQFNGWAHRPGFKISTRRLMRFHRAWKYGLVNSLNFQMRKGTIFEPIPVAVYFRPRRLAVTIHDVAPLLFPEQYKSKIFLHTYTSSMREADLIFTDSACSKNDMISRFGVPAGKIVVAYLGFERDAFRAGPVDTPRSREMLGRLGIARPYVLHVGRGDPRKNLMRLVQAYEALSARRKDLDFQLVLGGSLGWGYEPLLELLRKASLQGRIVVTGPVPDRELPMLYRAAACFAMPSLYEGFGLPVLEAMACGTPVMISDSSSLPEVGGDAALYFNPESVDEMSQVMERVMTDSGLREEMAKKGLERARQFSWEACARTTLAALKTL